MRRLSIAAAALLLAPGPAGAEDIDPYWLEAVPSEYRGRWNSDAKACAAFSGRGRIEISANRLVVAGDPFEAQRIAWGEEPGITVVSRYAGSAKPAWTRVDHFLLSADRKRLVNDHAGRKLTRTHCGAQ